MEENIDLILYQSNTHIRKILDHQLIGHYYLYVLQHYYQESFDNLLLGALSTLDNNIDERRIYDTYYDLIGKHIETTNTQPTKDDLLIILKHAESIVYSSDPIDINIDISHLMTSVDLMSLPETIMLLSNIEDEFWHHLYRYREDALKILYDDMSPIASERYNIHSYFVCKFVQMGIDILDHVQGMMIPNGDRFILYVMSLGRDAFYAFVSDPMREINRRRSLYGKRKNGEFYSREMRLKCYHHI